MDKFKLVVDKNALADIQEVTDWYNLQSKGLGSRFQKQAKSQISKLKRNAGNYGVR